jgi:hypothetical protein
VRFAHSETKQHVTQTKKFDFLHISRQVATKPRSKGRTRDKSKDQIGNEQKEIEPHKRKYAWKIAKSKWKSKLTNKQRTLRV